MGNNESMPRNTISLGVHPPPDTGPEGSAALYKKFTFELGFSPFAVHPSPRGDYIVASGRTGHVAVFARRYGDDDGDGTPEETKTFVPEFENSTVHEHETICCCWCPLTGLRFVAASKNSDKLVVNVWSAPLGCVLQRLGPDYAEEQRDCERHPGGVKSEVKSMAWSSDGSLLALKSSDGVTLLDANAGFTQLGYCDMPHTSGTWVTSIKFDRSGDRLLATDMADCVLLDARDENLRVLKRFVVGDSTETICMKAIFSLDERLVYSGGNDGKLKVWDVGRPGSPLDVYTMDGSPCPAAATQNGVVVENWKARITLCPYRGGAKDGEKSPYLLAGSSDHVASSANHVSTISVSSCGWDWFGSANGGDTVCVWSVKDDVEE